MGDTGFELTRFPSGNTDILKTGGSNSGNNPGHLGNSAPPAAPAAPADPDLAAEKLNLKRQERRDINGSENCKQPAIGPL